ncbi:MAG: glycosyl hydrolase, partial [Dehalococcoidia bacterium]
ITQRGANRLAMPILIGSNHLVRIAMMRSIGGYVSHVVEDHITGMVAMVTENPATGRRWRGVYERRIISRGEGPATWGAYLAQQMRWSFGLFEILRQFTPRLLWRLRPRQAAGLLLIQSYYPSVAAVFAIGVGLTSLQLFTGVGALNVGLGEWASYWVPPTLASMALWYWMQRFYLERTDRGVGVRGMLLGLGASLIYLQAMLAALAKRHLPYVITPKGQHAQREPLRLFRWHLFVLVLSVVSLAWSVTYGSGLGTLRVWAVLTSVFMALVIVSGAVVRPREAPRAARGRAGGRYWLRVATPATVLAAILITTAPTDNVPATGAAEARVGAAHAFVANIEVVQPTPVPRVEAAFLDHTQGRSVALGAFDPPGSFGTLPKIRHVFVDFRPEREREILGAVRAASANNQVAMITWEPRRTESSRSLAVLATDVTVLQEIAGGRLDGYVGRVARTLRDTEQPVIVRFAHEMDLAPDGSHPWSGGDPETFIEAWRHVHQVFVREGATNVRFLWSPGGVLLGNEFASARWYPGRDVVDLVGFSAFGSWQWEPLDLEAAPNGPDAYALRTPAELLLPRYRAIARYGKPVILPEVGLETHPGRLDEEERWLRAFADLIAGPDLPLLRGVVYFNAPHNLPNYDIDWRLNAEDMRVVREAWVQQAEVETASMGTTRRP